MARTIITPFLQHTCEQREWIEFNNKNGNATITGPDFYTAAKQGNNNLLAHLRTLAPYHIILADVFFFDTPLPLETRLVHDYGSAVVPQTEHILHLPFYEKKPISYALDNIEGTIEFLWAEFGTNDHTTELVKNLELITGKTQDNILLATPSQDYRKKEPKNAISFYTINGQFIISGFGTIDKIAGCSAGVSMNAETAVLH